MKKSTIAAFVALVMVFIYIFTAGDKFNIYEKENFYKTPEEAIHNFIGFINVKEKVKGKDGIYTNEAPKEFLESVSKRYRLYAKNGKSNKNLNSAFPSFKNCTIREIKEDKDTDYIKSNYRESFREIKGYEKAGDIRFFRIDGEGYFYGVINREDVNEDGTVNTVVNSEMQYEENKYITIDLVVIDEGEGYVVDYYNVSY
jgi:hypothetical protein